MDSWNMTMTVRHFSKGSDLVLICRQWQLWEHVLLVHWEFPCQPPAQHPPLVLVPGNNPSSPDTQGQSRGPSSPVACHRVASSKCLRKEYKNTEIKSGLFSFLCSQLPILRQVFQRCPFCALLCFSITQKKIETTVCN